MAHFLHEGYMPRVFCFYTETTAEEGRGFRPIGQELTVTFDARHLLFACRHSYHVETPVTY